MALEPLFPLPREAESPPGLRNRVFRTLRRRGLLGRRRTGLVRAAGSIAAAGAVFLGGVWVGSRDRSTAHLPEGPRFALLLYEDARFTPEAAGEDRVAEYGEWASRLQAEGRFDLGEKLEATVELVGRAAAPEAARLTGFFILRAATLAEAVEVARTCPHIRHGGIIAVRPIAST